MNIGISSIRTKDAKIVRLELVKSIQELGHKVFYIGKESNDSIHSDYEENNVNFLSIPVGRSNTNPLKEIKSIIKAKNALKDNNINAMIVYGIRTFPAMVIAAKLAGVKNVLCIVNGSGRLFELSGIKGSIIKLISYPMLWLAFMLCNNVLFQNPDDLQMVRKKGLLWKDNYGVINGSGVNIHEFYSTELETKPAFMMISRLTRSKGVNEYIEAAQQVKRKYPKAEFHLIGPLDDDTGIDKEHLQKAVNDNVIKLKGKVEDVRPYLKQARIFVLPSYYPEGVPRSILEAMAMGRPIITTDSPGCRETVIEGYNGFIIPPKNIDNLVEKMVWMIENEDQVDKMGKSSRRMCEKKFNVHKINKQIINKINL